MKKFNLSLVAVLAMSTFAIAGGDIAPVEPVIETPVVEESTPGGFYLGLAYGLSSVTEDIEGQTGLDEDYSAVMIQAGYKFNPYVAIEGRYWFGLAEEIAPNTDLTVDTWAIYVKPSYPITESFDVYGLLGYGNSEGTIAQTGFADDTETFVGFAWGAGVAYSLTESVALFVDYTSLLDSTDVANTTVDTTVSAVNFGVTYTF